MLQLGEDDKFWVRGALEELRRRLAPRTGVDEQPCGPRPFA